MLKRYPQDIGRLAVIVALLLMFIVDFAMAQRNQVRDTVPIEMNSSPGQRKALTDQSTPIVSINFRIDSILKKRRQINDTTELLILKFKLAQLYQANENYNAAILLAVQIINSLETPESQKFIVGKFLRDLYYKIGLTHQAIVTHSKLNWYHAPRNWEYYVPDNFLAFAFMKIGQYEKAISTLTPVVKEMHARDYKYWEFSFTNSLGVIYLKNQQLDSAWAQFLNAKELLEKNFSFEPRRTIHNYDYLDGLVSGNMAEVLAAKGRHLEAIPLYQFDIEQCSKFPNNKEIQGNLLYSYLKLAKSYIVTDQMVAANRCLKKTTEYLQIFDVPEQALELERCRWKYYEKLSLKDSALMAVNRYIQLRDSIESAKFKNELRNSQISIDSKTNEESLATKESELTQLRSKSEKEQFVRYAIILTIGLLFGLLLFLFRAYRIRLKREIDLSEKSNKITEQAEFIGRALEEKDLLLREVHHRVKNNLQIISSLFFLQAKKIKDEQARMIIQEGQSRVHVMSLIHQKLYQAEHLNLIKFQDFMIDIGGHIIQSNRRADLQIEMVIEAQNIEQPVDKGLPIGMIVSELITNSIKHAFKGRKTGHIFIRATQIEKYIRLEYEDDGIGLEALENLENTDSLGMKLIKLLTNQLDGTIEYDVTTGFKLYIEFPV